MNTSDRFLWVILVLVVIFLMAPLLLMFMVIPAMGPEWMHGEHAAGGWWFASILVLLFLLVAIGFVFFQLLIRGDGTDEDTALEELRVAYARGELDDEEYEKRYERLRES